MIGYTLREPEMALATVDLDDPMTAATEFLAGLSPEDHPYTVSHVRQHRDGDAGSSFELVLDLILDGLARLDTGSGPAS